MFNIPASSFKFIQCKPTNNVQYFRRHECVGTLSVYSNLFLYFPPSYETNNIGFSFYCKEFSIRIYILLEQIFNNLLC